MSKMIALLLGVLLALGSVAGYLFLNVKIVAGEKEMVNGQVEMETKEPRLDSAKVKLEVGKQKLSEGKEKYQSAKDKPFLGFLDKLLNRGKRFQEARDQISKGDSLVAIGEDKVSAGERRLAKGKLKLSQGAEKLRLAKGMRVAFALGAILFTSASVLMGLLWRRSLSRIVHRR